MSETTKVQIKPRVYLNGFPKSGLHRVLLLASAYCKPAIDGKAWAGTFEGNAWTADWTRPEGWFSKLACLREGTYLRGHSGYRPEIADFLHHMGAAVVFIYRDLRDVLVSQTFHSRSTDRESWSHPEKELFVGMDFEQAMVANLVGIQGDQFRYAGLRERWEQYAPWMGVDWVYKAQYEYTLREPLEFAADFVNYIFHRHAEAHASKFEATRDVLLGEAAVVAPAMDDPAKRKFTYRRGVAGGWRDHFTPYVTRLFKAQMGDWLIRLGYEKSNDWE